MMSLMDCEKKMHYCIELAKNGHSEGQYAIASLVVDGQGKILAARSSSLREKNDPTNHPEIAVIREASEIIKSRTLAGCYLFSTLEPCPMCTSAAIWAKMQGIVFGAYQEDAISYAESNLNTFSWRQIKIKARDVIEKGVPKLEVNEGVLRDECIKLFYL